MMIDLTGVASDLLVVNSANMKNGDNDGYKDENHGGIFISLAEFCINVISSPICGDSGGKVGGVSSKLICECVKSVCSGGMAFMFNFPSTEENFKGLTSVML